MRRRRRRRIPLHKFTLPFAGDEIQPPLTHRESTWAGGGNVCEHSEIFRILVHLRSHGRFVVAQFSTHSRSLCAFGGAADLALRLQAALEETISGQSIRCCHTAGPAGYK